MGVVAHNWKINTQEAETGVSLWVHNKFQNTQNYTETLSQNQPNNQTKTQKTQNQNILSQET